jgi:uncharacterized membrane protein
MERMLVVVFDNEKKAYEGQSGLRQLEREGSLTVYSGAIVVKHADGTVDVEQSDEFAPAGTLTGTAVGSLIGLLGGPVGLAIGATGGLAFGAAYDVDRARVGDDFIDDVSKSLTPNKVAVVVEVEEEWTTPVDAKMEAIGGIVFRRALWEVEDQVEDEHIAAMKADLAQFKAEAAKAHADRKAKLQKKADELQAKIEAQQNKAKERRQAFEARQKAKSAILKKNAAAAGRALKHLANTPV